MTIKMKQALILIFSIFLFANAYAQQMQSRTGVRAEELKKELQLEKLELEKVKVILRVRRENLADLRKELRGVQDLNEDEKVEKRKELRRRRKQIDMEADERLKSILTEEQFAKYDSIKLQKQQMRKRPPGGNRPMHQERGVHPPMDN